MPNTQRQIRIKRKADMPLYINCEIAQRLEHHTINVRVAGSNPVFAPQAQSSKGSSLTPDEVVRFNYSQGRKVFSEQGCNAVKGEILVHGLGFSFPIGPVRLPAVGGLLTLEDRT